MITFEWDANKATSNLIKHKISFDEAKTVFNDDNGLLIHDPDHSEDEDRFVLLGFSAKTNLLIVCHCYRDNDETIRIISAREATKHEEKQYNSQRGTT